MNRIILIGNGFDLAHGLKTSYADFIKWYWTKRVKGFHTIISDISDDGLCSFKIKGTYNTWSVLSYNFNPPFCKIDGKEIVDGIKANKNAFSVVSTPLFQEICYDIEVKGWADIEEIYYKHLIQQEYRSRPPKDVNDEFDKIRKELIEYLIEIQNGITNNVKIPEIQWKIFKPFSKEDIAIGSMEQWNEMLNARLTYNDDKWRHLVEVYSEAYGKDSYSVNSIKSFCKSHGDEIRSGKFDDVNELCSGFLLPDNILLLNFNYTDTADLYLPKEDDFQVNHIHGELSNPQSVIFGYGDELDENYKKMSEKKENEYLRNIKSVKYLESSNYRKMLEFIESSPYQVFIMGHSCGNSDRTLLNTLFEHRNCVSIKPFYHKNTDGSDNYLELVQNISRNFTDMKLMRDRVVNKTLCETI